MSLSLEKDLHDERTLRLAATVLGIRGTFPACSTFGVRTEGTSGPLAWRASDLAVVTRTVQGQEADTYDFTLHVKNVSDKPLTLTQMHRTVYQAGGGPEPVNKNETASSRV